MSKIVSASNSRACNPDASKCMKIDVDGVNVATMERVMIVVSLITHLNILIMMNVGIIRRWNASCHTFQYVDVLLTFCLCAIVVVFIVLISADVLLIMSGKLHELIAVSINIIMFSQVALRMAANIRILMKKLSGDRKKLWLL